MKNRRAFLKDTGIVCGGALLFGASFSSCAKLPVVKTSVENNAIVIEEATLTEGLHWIVRAPQLDNDLLLVRENAGSYHCLLMKCTHQDYPLSLAGNALVCNNHGSKFDLTGAVQKEPAAKPLKQFPVTKDQSKITITV
jgi:nitrite reductase/ring-hydroxylating ferredoxin subunit